MAAIYVMEDALVNLRASRSAPGPRQIAKPAQDALAYFFAAFVSKTGSTFLNSTATRPWSGRAPATIWREQRFLILGC